MIDGAEVDGGFTFGVLCCEQCIQIAVVVRMTQSVQDGAHLLLLYLSRLARVEHREGSSKHFWRRRKSLKYSQNIFLGELTLDLLLVHFLIMAISRNEK